MIGTLVKWGEERGFGFLKRDDSNDDVFLHISECHRAGIGTPQVGDRFQFEIGMRSDGRTFAKAVKLADGKGAAR